MEKVAVLINIYKSDLTQNEILSLKKCLNILEKYEKIFLGPDDIDLGIYKALAPNLKFHLVKASNFRGAANYSRYLLTEEFYSAFKHFNQVLIYQLDCYVFRDELDVWASQNFDYIGSPFFKDFEKNADFEFLGVGNGGFSLRNPSRILDLLKNWEKKVSYSGILKTKIAFTKNNKIRLIVQKFLSSLTGFIFHRPFTSILKNPKEDLILGLFFGKELNLLNTPTPQVASRFSSETNPEYLYTLNNKTLPFGCHAWEKYEPEFWLKFIQQDKVNLLSEN